MEDYITGSVHAWRRQCYYLSEMGMADEPRVSIAAVVYRAAPLSRQINREY